MSQSEPLYGNYRTCMMRDMSTRTYRRNSTTISVHGAGLDAGRGMLGEVVRRDGTAKRFEARIDRSCWGRFTRQADAVAEVARLHASIERGNALLAGWRP
jgi:hypothetical protein